MSDSSQNRISVSRQTPARLADAFLAVSQQRRLRQLGTVHCTVDELCGLVEAAVTALWSAGVAGYAVTSQAPLADVDRSLVGHRGPCVILVATTSDPGRGPTVPHQPCTTLFGELPRHDLLLQSVGIPKAIENDALRVVSRTFAPFTDAESAELVELNPLVCRMVDAYAAKGTDISGVTLYFREHLLLEKLNLLRGLIRLGLRPENVIVIGKPDVTFYRHRVVAELERSGMTVIDAPADIQAVVLATMRRRAALPIVAVDDGADLATALLALSAVSRIRVIETTSKGIRKLRREGNLHRVTNLSDASIKHDMSRQIASSCVYRFRELLRHEPLSGQECVVVGFGRLGSFVATLLTQLGLVVRVAEVDPVAMARADAAGFASFPDLPSAATSSVRYLFGCSGERAVTLDDVRLLGDTVVLCALSSQDLVPTIDSLTKLAAASPVRGIGTRYRLGKQTVTVLADGHAINLHWAEGVSEPDFDPFTTLTGIAIIESARALAEPADSREATDPEDFCQIVRDLRSGSTSGQLSGE